MSNCVNCTDIGAEQAMNGNRYLCPNCRPKNDEPEDDPEFREQATEALQEVGLTEDEAELAVDDFLAGY